MSSSELVFSLRNQRSEIGRMFSILEEFCQQNGISDDDLFNIRLVLDEAVINVVMHGYEDMAEHLSNVALSLVAEVLTIHMDDDGVPYNPLNAPAPRFDLPVEQRRIGGLGVHIMKTLARKVEYRREDNRNHLTIELNMTLGAAASS